MRQPILAVRTRAPALPGPDRRRPTGPTDRRREPRPSRLWALVEALAYAGAFVDPSGILAVERLRRAQEEAEEEERRGRR